MYRVIEPILRYFFLLISHSCLVFIKKDVRHLRQVTIQIGVRVVDDTCVSFLGHLSCTGSCKRPTELPLPSIPLFDFTRSRYTSIFGMFPAPRYVCGYLQIIYISPSLQSTFYSNMHFLILHIPSIPPFSLYYLHCATRYGLPSANSRTPSIPY